MGAVTLAAPGGLKGGTSVKIWMEGEALWVPVLTEEDLEQLSKVAEENDRLDRERAKAWKKSELLKLKEVD